MPIVADAIFAVLAVDKNGQAATVFASLSPAQPPPLRLIDFDLGGITSGSGQARGQAAGIGADLPGPDSVPLGVWAFVAARAGCWRLWMWSDPSSMIRRSWRSRLPALFRPGL